MKKIITAAIIFLAFSVAISGANAQMTDSDFVSDDHTAREEAEGKAIWEKLQAKQITCADLSDEDFGVLGEYYMGQMVGDSHESMNTMMTQMMGEEGEEQMHVVMGKRFFGCDTSAAFPAGGNGFMPMTQMMGGNNSMMGNWGQSPMWWGGAGSWFASLLWLVWLIVGILVIVWLWKQISKK